MRPNSHSQQAGGADSETDGRSRLMESAKALPAVNMGSGRTMGSLGEMGSQLGRDTQGEANLAKVTTSRGVEREELSRKKNSQDKSKGIRESSRGLNRMGEGKGQGFSRPW